MTRRLDFRQLVTAIRFAALQQHAENLAVALGARLGASVRLVQGRVGFLPPFVDAPCTLKVVGIHWVNGFALTGSSEHVLVRVFAPAHHRSGMLRLDTWAASTAEAELPLALDLEAGEAGAAPAAGGVG